MSTYSTSKRYKRASAKSIPDFIETKRETEKILEEANKAIADAEITMKEMPKIDSSIELRDKSLGRVRTKSFGKMEASDKDEAEPDEVEAEPETVSDLKSIAPNDSKETLKNFETFEQPTTVLQGSETVPSETFEEHDFVFMNFEKVPQDIAVSGSVEAPADTNKEVKSDSDTGSWNGVKEETKETVPSESSQPASAPLGRQTRFYSPSQPKVPRDSQYGDPEPRTSQSVDRIDLTKRSKSEMKPEHFWDSPLFWVFSGSALVGAALAGAYLYYKRDDPTVIETLEIPHSHTTPSDYVMSAD